MSIFGGKNRSLSLASFLWIAFIVIYAYRQYMEIVYDPSQASLMNDATGVFLNIILIGLALQFAVFWFISYLRRQAKKRF